MPPPMYKTIRQGLPLLALLISTFSIAHETAPAAASMGASSHAPIGVMGDPLQAVVYPDKVLRVVFYLFEKFCFRNSFCISQRNKVYC